MGNDVHLESGYGRGGQAFATLRVRDPLRSSCPPCAASDHRHTATKHEHAELPLHHDDRPHCPFQSALGQLEASSSFRLHSWRAVGY